MSGVHEGEGLLSRENLRWYGSREGQQLREVSVCFFDGGKVCFDARSDRHVELNLAFSSVLCNNDLKDQWIDLLV